MEAAYSDDPDPEGDAYAAGVAAGSDAPTRSATAPRVVEVVDVNDDVEDDAPVEVVEGDEEVQLAARHSLDSFRAKCARQKELGKQEAADLERVTKDSLIYARRKCYRDGAASSPEEGTGSCH